MFAYPIDLVSLVAIVLLACLAVLFIKQTKGVPKDKQYLKVKRGPFVDPKGFMPINAHNAERDGYLERQMQRIFPNG